KKKEYDKSSWFSDYSHVHNGDVIIGDESPLEIFGIDSIQIKLFLLYASLAQERELVSLYLLTTLKHKNNALTAFGDGKIFGYPAYAHVNNEKLVPTTQKNYTYLTYICDQNLGMPTRQTLLNGESNLTSMHDWENDVRAAVHDWKIKIDRIPFIFPSSPEIIVGTFSTKNTTLLYSKIKRFRNPTKHKFKGRGHQIPQLGDGIAKAQGQLTARFADIISKKILKYPRKNILKCIVIK
ncbi:hypothetical protein ACJX0J_040737, partial [Zea mays]